MKKWTELVELMNTPVSVKVTNKDTVRNEFGAEFRIDAEEDFKFSFDAWGGKDGWEISFSRILFASIGEVSTHSLIGDLSMKDALKVFSGIKKSFKMWLKWVDDNESDFEDIGKVGPDLQFYFTGKSDEVSRIKLYNKFAKVIAKETGTKVRKGTWGTGEILWAFKRV